jgi:hypothetical protein
MSDHWTDRLSDYLDGELAPAEADVLEQHLVACDECRTTLAELRSVVEAAAALPVMEPSRDLWAGIAAGIGAADKPETIDLQQYAARRAVQRRFSFSMPQLAAAAVLLVAISAGGMWWLVGGHDGPQQVAGVIVHAADLPANGARLVSTAPERTPLDGDIARLEAALDEARDRLDPATVEIIERSLDAIDQAIDDARAALVADPGNAQLERQLDNTMQKKLDVLRRVYSVQRAGA